LCSNFFPDEIAVCGLREYPVVLIWLGDARGYRQPGPLVQSILSVEDPIQRVSRSQGVIAAAYKKLGFNLADIKVKLEFIAGNSKFDRSNIQKPFAARTAKYIIGICRIRDNFSGI
jgi:hypothetical protein